MSVDPTSIDPIHGGGGGGNGGAISTEESWPALAAMDQIARMEFGNAHLLGVGNFPARVRAPGSSTRQVSGSRPPPSESAPEGQSISAKGSQPVSKSVQGKAEWVDENAGMSPRARAYQDDAPGARSNLDTRKPQAPQLTYRNVTGAETTIRFDGAQIDGTVLIDRKLSIVTTAKAQNQALRQSMALQQNGMTGVWQVPDKQAAARATKMLRRLEISNIAVEVVPEAKQAASSTVTATTTVGSR